jgi:hypothetical protein
MFISNDYKDDRARTNRKTKKDSRTSNTYRKKPYSSIVPSLTSHRLGDMDGTTYNGVPRTVIDVMCSKYYGPYNILEINNYFLDHIIEKLDELAVTKQKYTSLKEGQIVTVSDYKVPCLDNYNVNTDSFNENHIRYIVTVPGKSISGNSASILSKDSGNKPDQKTYRKTGGGPCRGEYVYTKRQESRSRSHMIKEER